MVNYLVSRVNTGSVKLLLAIFSLFPGGIFVIIIFLVCVYCWFLLVFWNCRCWFDWVEATYCYLHSTVNVRKNSLLLEFREFLLKQLIFKNKNPIMVYLLFNFMVGVGSSILEAPVNYPHYFYRHWLEHVYPDGYSCCK